MAITCERYRKLPGSKRCQYYEDNGACRLSTNIMCVEWLKLNASRPSSGSSPPPRPSTLASRIPPPPAPERTPTAPAPERKPITPEDDPIAPALLLAFTPERIEHLKRERIEMLVTFDSAGDVLITPEPTEPDPLDEFERLTYDDVLAIASVAVQFPGAYLKRVRKPKGKP
jgi:hypothetical protein